MVLGYHFLDLSSDQKQERRRLLDIYANIAQFSVLLVFALFQLTFFIKWLAGKAQTDGPPRSPSLDKLSKGPWSWLTKFSLHLNRILWWTRKDIYGRAWGSRAEWLGGSVWMFWLIYLSMAHTGRDYLHLTKRFGAIAASQLPFHYLLAMRSPYSPIQKLTRLSHEQLKASHNLLGRIIFILFTFHVIFYLNFFLASSLLAKRLQDTDVILGIISFVLFSILSTTTLGQIRRWNYRLFYISHILIAYILVIPLYFHVHHIRLYIWEIVSINVMHVVSRSLDLNTFEGKVQLVEGTNLIQIRIPLTAKDLTLGWRPGQHMYLSFPTGKAYTKSFYDQYLLRYRTNPFSIASIPAEDKELLLVIRAINGNTKKLEELARRLARTPGHEVSSIPIALEGPYGVSRHLPDLHNFDRVLFVAGGIGATFTVPLYRNIKKYQASHSELSLKPRFIWAVRTIEETQWAFPASTGNENGVIATETISDDCIELFLTRQSNREFTADENDGGIELAEMEGLLPMQDHTIKLRRDLIIKQGRPNIESTADGVFRKGGRIAVIACGPAGLTAQLRTCVDRWVMQGSDIFFHEEVFAW